MSWEERADLAEATVAPACDLAGLVHDGDAEAVRLFLERFGLGDDSPMETKALVVVLAAMVDMERSDADLLAWVGGGPVTVLPQLRQCAGELEPEGPHTARELRDAAAEEMRLKRAGLEVPGELKAMLHHYRKWRRQIQGLKEDHVSAA